MKVLVLNGSPRANGNTAAAIEEMKKIFDAEGVETEVVRVGNLTVKGCQACGACVKLGKCVNDGDIVNELLPKLAECDGLVLASPVYYAAANGTLVTVLNRLFYSNSADLSMKVGASVAVARRGGCTGAFDELNKFFTINGMPIASSSYWNMVFGAKPGEASSDEEGLRTMRILAKNMVFLMKSIALGKEQFGLPEKEAPARTNFIR